MFNSKIKPGEVINVGIQQLDENGDQISMTIHTINGLDNAGANTVNETLVSGVLMQMKQYGEVKTQRRAAEGDERAKKTLENRRRV